MTANTPDECLQAVGDECRREIIRELRSGDESETTLERLAERFGEGGERHAPTAITLHHNHLPKLAAIGIVDYDSASGVVQYRPDEEVEGLLDQLAAEPQVAKR